MVGGLPLTPLSPLPNKFTHIGWWGWEVRVECDNLKVKDGLAACSLPGGASIPPIPSVYLKGTAGSRLLCWGSFPSKAGRGGHIGSTVPTWCPQQK